MAARGAVSEILLVNGSAGDPVVFVDYPGRDDALLLDAGENSALGLERLGDLRAVFLTHHHIDHFIGLDRIVRANLDRDKTLSIFGPPGTIRKVFDRVTSYEHPFFPFQKLILAVHDVEPGTIARAALSVADKFPEPIVETSSWTGPLLLETADLRIEAAPCDHTVPCLAYAIVEPKGVHPDPDRFLTGSLRRGAWVGQALAAIRDGLPDETPIAVDGGWFPLGTLEAAYFRKTSGARVAYVTDTAWSEKSRPGLLRLAHKADRLYCDSFYARAEAKQAEKYRHMTATQAAEFALEAGVAELILIHFASRYKGRYESLVEEARAIFPRTSAVL